MKDVKEALAKYSESLKELGKVVKEVKEHTSHLHNIESSLDKLLFDLGLLRE